MRNFVADNDPYGSVVHGIDGIHIKSGRLKNAGGKDDLVPAGVVVGIRGGRRHSPATAINRLSDRLKVVFHNETPRRKIVLEKCISANINLAVVFPLIG